MAKKLLALLLAVMLVTSLIAPAYAVEADKAPTAASTRTITIGVISYVISDIGDSGYQVHYWGGSDGAKDADLTKTGKTEQKSVGSGYWNNAPQTFTMYTAEIPADATGYKVHKGDRWFGENGAPAKNVAYIFNYDGDKALYETAVEPTEAPAVETDAPAEPTQAEDTITVYFVDKLGWGDVHVYYWPNGGDWPGAPAETVTGEVYETPINGASTYKAIVPASVDGIIFNGNGSQTVDITTGIADGAKWSAIDEKDGGKYKVELVTAEDPTDAPVVETDAPAAEGAYYIVGSMNDWAAADAYKLTKNEAAEADEYTITLDLAKDAAFKVIYTDGKTTTWYPDGTDNNYVVSADGTYDIYFRPNGDGGEDWHYGVIYAAAQTEPSTDEPIIETDEPATAEPETAEPATDEPVAEGAYYLVGSMNDWAAADAYKLTKNEAAEGDEYTITLELAKDAAFKVIYTDGKTTTWYPDGMGNDYTITADGTYDIYFRPNGDGGEDWHYGVIYAALRSEQPTDEPATAEPETAEPATDAPVAEGAYYLIGSMNDWAAEDAYKLTKNEAAEGDEYTITLDLAKDAEFKVVYSDGTAQTWYPDGTDNNYVVSADGTYDIYFRPNGDGGEDWHYGVIYAAAQTEPSTDEPIIETAEPATAEPETAEPATDEPAAEGAYYIVGSMNDWAAADAYKLTKNEAAEGDEYTITLELAKDAAFKVIYTDGKTTTWYPDGMGNDYTITADGTYDVYFRPNGDGGEDWHYGVIYAALQSEQPTSEPSTDVVPTQEPATDEPVVGSDFFLVSNMNDWAAADAYKLTKNEAAEGDEYTITLELAKDAAFKVIYTDGKTTTWYPDGADNNYVVSADGTYDIYFRPNGDGGEDWHYGVIYAALRSEQPTDEPATAEPETAEPATDAPVAEGAYYIVGSMNDWAAADAYKLTKNEAAEGDEYTITLELAKDAAFKVIYTDGKTTTWYPDGADNNYVVSADGTYDIYFRPNGDGGEDWHYGVIYAALQSEQPTDEPATAEPETAEPATDEPVAEGAYYIVGSMNDWAAADAYKLTKNEAAEGDEYTITLELAKDAAFKVIYTDGKTTTWYPDGADNNYVVSADGTYDIYFRPNGDGGEDWHYGVIYAALRSEQPTDEPSTDVVPTQEPATDEPVVGSDFFLVSNMNDWAAADAYKLTKNEAAEGDEYTITLDLTTDSQFKIIKLDGFDVIWYPGGMGNNFGENGEIKVNGNYTVYFRPNGDGGEDWFNGVIYVTLNAEAPTSEPATEEPVEEGAYYVVGNMNNWEVNDAYKLTKNEAAEGDEYTITLDLTTESQFKVVYSKDGSEKTTWYPDGMGNNFGENGEIKADGTYDIYFRPNGDGYDDWFYDVIIVIAKSDEPTQPSEEPSTPAVIYGDADGDGEITSLDITMIQRALAHLNPAGYNPDVCDVDGDGEITSMDVSWIQRSLAHMSIPENVRIG